MKSFLRPLQNKDGKMYIQAVVYIIILMMVFLLLLTFTLAVSVASSQQKSAEQILDQYIQLNSIMIYSEVKEHSDKTAEMLQSLYVEKLVEQQDLTLQDGIYCSLNEDGDPRYKVSNIELDFEVDYTAKAVLKYNLSVPMSFMGTVIWPDIPVSITSRFNPKFD